MNAKDRMLSEKQATFAKYIALGLKPYYGLTGEPQDEKQTKLQDAYEAEIAAIERRYKIEAGQS